MIQCKVDCITNFDYILNLPVVSIDNYDAILNGLLYELKDKLIDLGLVMLEDAV